MFVLAVSNFDNQYTLFSERLFHIELHLKIRFQQSRKSLITSSESMYLYLTFYFEAIKNTVKMLLRNFCSV